MTVTTPNRLILSIYNLFRIFIPLIFRKDKYFVPGKSKNKIHGNRFIISRSREPAFRCNFFCIKFSQSKVPKVNAKKDFHYNQGYGFSVQNGVSFSIEYPTLLSSYVCKILDLINKKEKRVKNKVINCHQSHRPFGMLIPLLFYYQT